MVCKSLLRPGRAALIVLMTVAMASMAFARGSTEKKNAAAAGPTQAAAEFGPGVLVIGVVSGSPAEKAGIARGDIILQADGKDLNTPIDLQRAVIAHKTGDTLSLKIKHGDAEKTVSVTLTELNNRPYLGVEPYGAGFGMMAPFSGQLKEYPRSGAVVANVVSGAPADKAGIKMGDVILSVDGTAVTPQNDLAGLIAQRKPGDTVALSVESSGQKPREVQVTLGTNPQKADAPYLGIQYTLGAARLGMAPFAMPFGPGMNRQFRDFRNNGGNKVFQGAMVDAVADNSPAAQAGIKPRDVITAIDGVTILAPRQVVDTVANHKSGDKITVTVFRFNENKSINISVTLGSSPSGAAQANGAYMGITMSRYIGYSSPEANGPQTDLQTPPEKQQLELPAPGGA